MITYKFRDIFNISSPLALGMFIQVMVGVTDTAFLGRVGEIELGASAIGGIFYLLIFMIAQSFSVGAQIIMARRNGEQNYVKIAQVFYQTISFIFLFSIISIAGIYFGASSVLDFIVESDIIKNAVLIYLLPRCWGLFFSGAKTALRSFFVALTTTKQLLPAALILVISNFVFDYWLIFGGFGIEPMGLKGAAIASVLAEGLAVLYLVIYILLFVKLRKYGFHKFLLWSQSLFNEIFRLSIWIIVQNLLSWGAWFYFFIEIEKLGASELAVSNILRSLSSLPFILANALAMVTSSVVSNLIGAGKEREVIATIKRILQFAAVPYYGFFVLIAFIPTLFLQIYTNDVNIIQQSIAPFYTMMFTYFTALPGMIYFYAIYGTGKTKVAFWIEFWCSIAYIITIRLVVGIMQLDLMWCWMCELSYYLILFPVSYWYIKRNKWCCEIV